MASKKPFEENDEEELEFATRRILLLHGVIFTVGGIPLIYLGDELGTLNDYSFRDDPELEGDSRWVHRARFDPQRADLRRAAQTIPARIYQGLLRLVQIRQQNLAFTRGDTEIMDPGNDQVFGFFRHHDDQSVLVLANFSEREQAVSGKRLRLLGLRRTFTDIVEGKTITATQTLILEPYQFLVLIGGRRPATREQQGHARRRLRPAVRETDAAGRSPEC